MSALLRQMAGASADRRWRDKNMIERAGTQRRQRERQRRTQRMGGQTVHAGDGMQPAAVFRRSHGLPAAR